MTEEFDIFPNLPLCFTYTMATLYLESLTYFDIESTSYKNKSYSLPLDFTLPQNASDLPFVTFLDGETGKLYLKIDLI